MDFALAERLDELPSLLGVVLGGGCVGFLSGIFGIGGGFLLVPVLHIVLNVEMNLAVGAGACHVLGPATTSLLARRITCRQTRLPLTIAGGLLVGVFSGTHVLELAKQQQTFSLAGKTVKMADIVVLTTYFVLLLGVGLFALWEAHGTRTWQRFCRGWIAGWHIPPYANFKEFDQLRVSIVTLCWFGLAVGFLSGLLGMSGGLIVIPGLIYLLGMKTHQAVFCSLVIIWIVAFQATIAHALNNNIDIPCVMALLLGGTVGARFGSEVGVRLGGRQLRWNFGWLLLGTALLIGGRLIWLVAI